MTSLVKDIPGTNGAKVSINRGTGEVRVHYGPTYQHSDILDLPDLKQQLERSDGAFNVEDTVAKVSGDRVFFEHSMYFSVSRSALLQALSF